MPIISRRDALEKGLSKYKTGIPCVNGHVCERYVSTYACVECTKQFNSSPKKKEQNKLWKLKNKDYVKQYNKNWSINNQDKIKSFTSKSNEYINEYSRNKYATDLDFKTKEIARKMLQRILKSVDCDKTTETSMLLGYTGRELKESIESKFLSGMSWDNYGEWHIDHICPITRHIQNGVRDPSTINALDNLIPMWGTHNLGKSNRTLGEFLEHRPDLRHLYGQFLKRREI